MALKKRLTLIGANRPAKAMCSSGVIFWSRKKITPYSFRAPRISSVSACDKGLARSTPWISAPRAPEVGRTSKWELRILRSSIVILIIRIIILVYIPWQGGVWSRSGLG